MRPALENHQVRLAEVDDVGAPEVRAALDVDTVVVLDEVASLALDRLPFAVVDPLRVVLADDLPWAALYGAPLLSLLDAWAGDVGGSSVLRTCALLGLGLEPMGAGAFFPLGYLLAMHRERFPELSWSPPRVSPA